MDLAASPHHAAPRIESAGPAPEAAIARGRTAACLRSIHEPEIELVLWERPPMPGLAGWLDALPDAVLPDGRVLVSPADLEPAIASIFEASGTPPDAMRDLLAADVAALARLFAGMMAVPLVDIRLETVRHDACWKYHRDCVPARLITTYRGPGTEWVPPRLGPLALARQRGFRGPVERFPPYAVGLFKGSCAPPASGIVHRSPPIRGRGIARLVLCLNLETAASPDAWSG